MTRTTTLTFAQQLIVMEAVEELAAHVRDLVAAGDISMQHTLDLVEDVQRLVSVGTVQTVIAEAPKEAA